MRNASPSAADGAQLSVALSAFATADCGRAASAAAVATLGAAEGSASAGGIGDPAREPPPRRDDSFNRMEGGASLRVWRALRNFSSRADRFPSRSAISEVFGRLGEAPPFGRLGDSASRFDVAPALAGRAPSRFDAAPGPAGRPPSRFDAIWPSRAPAPAFPPPGRGLACRGGDGRAWLPFALPAAAPPLASTRDDCPTSLLPAEPAAAAAAACSCLVDVAAARLLLPPAGALLCFAPAPPPLAWAPRAPLAPPPLRRWLIRARARVSMRCSALSGPGRRKASMAYASARVENPLAGSAESGAGMGGSSAPSAGVAPAAATSLGSSRLLKACSSARTAPDRKKL